MSASALKSGFALMPVCDSVFITSPWFPTEMDSGTESLSYVATPVSKKLLKETKEKQKKQRAASVTTNHSTDLHEFFSLP